MNSTFTSPDFIQDTVNFMDDKLSFVNNVWNGIVTKMENEYGCSEMFIFLSIGFIVHGLVFQSLNIFYAGIHYSGLFKKYKIQQDKFPSWDLRKKIYPCLVKARLIQMVCSVIIYQIWKAVGGDNHNPLPNFTTLLGHFLFAFLFLETWFYWGHRTMHEVKWLREWHNQHHEFRTPVGLAAEYADWKEDIFVNFCSTTLGIILCACHPIEFYFFISFRLWETVDVHSGYQLPFTPFRAELHDYHHMRQNGCYGAFFMDELFGTDKRFKEHLKKKRENKL